MQMLLVVILLVFVGLVIICVLAVIVFGCEFRFLVNWSEQKVQRPNTTTNCLEKVSLCVRDKLQLRKSTLTTFTAADTYTTWT